MLTTITTVILHTHKREKKRSNQNFCLEKGDIAKTNFFFQILQKRRKGKTFCFPQKEKKQQSLLANRKQTAELGIQKSRDNLMLFCLVKQKI
jgi:hypothetical protein